MSNITPFNFDSHQVRVVTDEHGEPWFVAADVASALTISRTDDAISRLDDDEKGADTIRTPGGDQQMTVINESGLYSLILTSRKPEAKRFKKWVTSEVLPSIRKTGSYTTTTKAAPVAIGPEQDKMNALLALGSAVSAWPGVKPGIAQAATLTMIAEQTGINTDHLRRALPPASHPICSHNATAIGEAMGVSAREANLRLERAGYQSHNERKEWELTNDGKAWGEALPFSTRGHSGYQILWNPAVVDQLKAKK
jgi:prophage antirepressor-like protein